MTPLEHRSYAQMYGALHRICAYQTPDELRKRSIKDYGLDAEEAIEMAYENILQEAKAGLRRLRKPAAIQIEKGLNR
jgi:hypothetical protein